MKNSSNFLISIMKTFILKYSFFILTILFFISCTSKNNAYAVEQTGRDTTKFVSYFNSDTTIYSNGKEFRIRTIDPNFENSDSLLVTVQKDSSTIFTGYIDKGGLCDLNFEDFNNDKHFDILFYRGQQMGENELYLYDSLNNTFVKSIGYERFREPIQLKSDPNYYYSYCRAGCADMNWTSYLFTFKNFETIAVGYIYGEGCEDANPRNINIYKVLNNNEEDLKLVKKIPYSILERNADKWPFIEKYWNKNYQKFK